MVFWCLVRVNVMLNRVVLFVACFLALVAVLLFVWCSIQSNRIKSLQALKTSLEANNNILINRLEKEHNDKVELGKRTEELEKAIMADTSGFNWDYDLSANNVLLTFKRMHNAKTVH